MAGNQPAEDIVQHGGGIFFISFVLVCPIKEWHWWLQEISTSTEYKMITHTHPWSELFLAWGFIQRRGLKSGNVKHTFKLWDSSLEHHRVYPSKKAEEFSLSTFSYLTGSKHCSILHVSCEEWLHSRFKQNSGIWFTQMGLVISKSWAILWLALFKKEAATLTFRNSKYLPSAASSTIRED